MRRFLWALVPLLLVVSAACSPATFNLERIQRAGVKVLPGKDGFLHPITGVVHYTPKEWQKRPVLAIKIGNTSPERPQAGIDKADLVYEELVEAGATRLIALFSTEAPDRVGPVRSARFVDPVILRPIAGLIGYSGAIPAVVSAVRSTPGLKDVGAFSSKSGFYIRDRARRAPYNMYTSAAKLFGGEEGSPPAPLFGFLSSDEELSTGQGEPAKDASFSFSGSVRIDFSYDEQTGSYARSQNDVPHVVEGPNGGGRLSFRNVLVQKIGVSQGSGTDQAGARTQESDVVGKGEALLLRGGKAFRGTWDRPSADKPTRFLAPDGQLLRLAPGQTIIELVPSGNDVSLS